MEIHQTSLYELCNDAIVKYIDFLDKKFTDIDSYYKGIIYYSSEYGVDFDNVNSYEKYVFLTNFLKNNPEYLKFTLGDKKVMEICKDLYKKYFSPSNINSDFFYGFESDDLEYILPYVQKLNNPVLAATLLDYKHKHFPETESEDEMFKKFEI